MKFFFILQLLVILLCIVTSIPLPYSSSTSSNKLEYEECIKLSKLYKDLDMKCEKLMIINNNNATDRNHKTNSFMLNAFNNYKQNVSEMYRTYMQDDSYKKFINTLNTTIREKKNDPKSNYRFLQNKLQDGVSTLGGPKSKEHIDLSMIFDDKARKKISSDFVNTLSSQKLIDEVKTDYKRYKDLHLDKMSESIDNFYIKEEQEGSKDEKVKGLGERFRKSIDNYINKHMKEYNQDGIITVDGKISHHPHQYIQSEEKMLKEKYKEDSYSLEDMNKLLKLDQFLV